VACKNELLPRVTLTKPYTPERCQGRLQRQLCKVFSWGKAIRRGRRKGVDYEGRTTVVPVGVRVGAVHAQAFPPGQELYPFLQTTSSPPPASAPPSIFFLNPNLYPAHVPKTQKAARCGHLRTLPVQNGPRVLSDTTNSCITAPRLLLPYPVDMPTCIRAGPRITGENEQYKQ
jgi:hypothetical protein